MIQFTLLLLTGIMASMTGGLPFGLVNLTVLNVSMEKGMRAAMRISHGAAFIEVVFALTALLAGSLLLMYGGALVWLWAFELSIAIKLLVSVFILGGFIYTACSNSKSFFDIFCFCRLSCFNIIFRHSNILYTESLSWIADI